MSAITAKQLTDFKLLDALTSKELESIRSVMKEKHFASGKVIFHEGDGGGTIYFLLAGEVEISQSLTLPTSKLEDYDHREKSIVRLSGEHSAVFGEVSLYSRHEDKRTATVTALTDCRMGLLTGANLDKIMDSNPDVGYKVMGNLARTVCDRLITANRNVLKLTTALSLVLEK
ncbi:MAG: cyclic nucleotide-binding domain-containing protein [Candidatus Neomarinimicrobiota bacterium]